MLCQGYDGFTDSAFHRRHKSVCTFRIFIGHLHIGDLPLGCEGIPRWRLGSAGSVLSGLTLNFLDGGDKLISPSISEVFKKKGVFFEPLLVLVLWPPKFWKGKLNTLNMYTRKMTAGWHTKLRAGIKKILLSGYGMPWGPWGTKSWCNSSSKAGFLCHITNK